MKNSNDDAGDSSDHSITHRQQNGADGAQITQWEVIVEISLGDAMYKLPVRGPLGLEPTCEGERGRQELEFIRKVFTKFYEGLSLACTLDSSLRKLAPGVCIDFATESMAMEEACVVANPHWVCENEPMAIAVIIIHELRHLQRNDYVLSRAFLDSLDPSEPRRVWQKAYNAGADLVINSELLPALEKAGLHNDYVIPGQGAYTEFPLGLEAVDYARRIMADPQLRANMADHVAVGDARRSGELNDKS